MQTILRKNSKEVKSALANATEIVMSFVNLDGKIVRESLTVQDVLKVLVQNTQLCISKWDGDNHISISTGFSGGHNIKIFN